MPSCVVPTCKNAAGFMKKADGITFHLFPADEQRKSKWIKIIQRARVDEFWKPCSRSVICSIHFEEQYIYDTKCGLKRLKKTAIPTKHLALSPEFGELQMDESKSSTSDNVAQPQSPTAVSDISDVESIFDSPGKVKLKSQLRRKQIICERHVRRLKTLQQKHKRLAKKYESLKCILRNLKNNRFITFKR
ncbi:unnamed protein product [Spodoptera exigua]|nr:unnamed protein product [Spodoptera exigua]